MQREDALKALDIYRRVGLQVCLMTKFPLSIIKFTYPEIYVLRCFIWVQAERLSEFYEICRNLDIGRGEKFIKVEQVG
jgi:clathrin coat assembly protein AP180